ncbi:hypothetical protein [Mycobacterium sp.]
MMNADRGERGRTVLESVGEIGAFATARLVVDRRIHGEELDRFEANVVRGPETNDCAIWRASLGGDGYGRWWVRRGGMRIMVRANRYALASAVDGAPLEPWVRALDGCNNTVCVCVSSAGETGLLHVVPGSQRDIMVMMARAGRGGGCVAVRRGDNVVKARRARAVALRDAVRNGWDADAVAAALLGSKEPTLW